MPPQACLKGCSNQEFIRTKMQDYENSPYVEKCDTDETEKSPNRP